MKILLIIMEKKKSETGFYAILAVAVLLVAGAIWLLYDRIPASTPVETAAERTVPATLEGNYSMKLVSGTDVSYSTASVQPLAEGQYSIVRITVYGPMHYSVRLSSDGSLFSEELGSGFAQYDAALGKTTLRLEKDNVVCELTK